MGTMIDGWDNAPEVEIEYADNSKLVTIVYPYYENPFTLAKRLYDWCSLPQAIRKYLCAIIVDDCSPDHPAKQTIKTTPQPFPLRLFRIEKDCRWNWLAARNIAMHYAHDGWCVATDIDHIIPQETLETLAFGSHDPNCIYRFKRKEKGNFIHAHPNSWFMTKKMFWQFGGYDEALSGYYGTDGEARRRWVKTAPVFTMKDYLVREEYVMDSSTTRYKRKEAIDRKAQEIIKNRPADWKPKTLSFPYHEVNL